MVPSPSHKTFVHNSLYLEPEDSVKRGLAGTAILVMQNLHENVSSFSSSQAQEDGHRAGEKAYNSIISYRIFGYFVNFQRLEKILSTHRQVESEFFKGRQKG
jgi:hypothetical protein